MFLATSPREYNFFDFCSLVLLCLSSLCDASYFKEIASNRVALVGERVVLQCSVDNARSIPFWSVSREGVSETIARGFMLADIFNHTHEILLRVLKTTNRHYDLVIKRVKISDAGFYTCFDSAEAYDVTVSLSVMTPPKCSSSAGGYRCIFSSNGPFALASTWKCSSAVQVDVSEMPLPYQEPECIEAQRRYQKYEELRREKRSSEGLQEFWDLQECRFSLLTYKFSMATLNDSMATCNFSITSSSSVQSNNFPNLNPLPPNFSLTIHPVSTVKLSVSQGDYIDVNSTIYCFAESPIETEYQMVIRQLGIRQRGNSLKVNTSGIFDVQCLALNALNCRPVSTVSRDVKVVKKSEKSICNKNDLEKCDLYIFRVFERQLFTKFTKNNHTSLCQRRMAFKQCICKMFPCRLSHLTHAIVLAFDYWCEAGFKASEKMKMNFELRYPHMLMRKYYYPELFNPYFITPPQDFLNYSLSDKILLSYCDRLVQVSYVLSQEAFALVKERDNAKWARTLYSKLAAIEMEDYENIRVLRGTARVGLRNCTKFNRSSQRATKLCEAYKYCAKMHSSMLEMYHYGYVYVRSNKELLGELCEYTTENIDECERVLISSCQGNIKVLVSSFKGLLNELCNFKHTSKFLFYQESCYDKLDDTAPPPWSCARNFSTALLKDYEKKHGDKMLYQAAVCGRVKDFLECLEDQVMQKCKDKVAAKIQTSLSRMVLSHGLKDFFCHSAFLHSEFAYAINSQMKLSSRVCFMASLFSLIFS